MLRRSPGIPFLPAAPVGRLLTLAALALALAGAAGADAANAADAADAREAPAMQETPAPAPAPAAAQPASGAPPAPAATASAPAGGTPAGAASAAEAGVSAEAQKISFRDAVDRALAANSTVAEAVAEVLRAEALVKETRASVLPTVGVTAGYTRYQYNDVFEGIVFQPFGVETETGTIAVPLVNLTNWAAWAHAIDNKTIAKLSIADAKRRVAQATANDYLMVLERHRTLEANQRALETAKAHFDVAHQRLAAGAASRLEEVQASQDLSNDEVLVEQAALDLRRAQEALGVLLSGDGPFDAADEPSFADLGSIQEAVANVDLRRSDLQVLAMRQTAAEHVLRDSWRDWVPTLGLNVQEILTQPATAFALPHTWEAQLLLSWPIYEGGLRFAQRSERDALVKEAQANLTGGKVQARSDVRIANDAIRLADQGLVSARNAARLAHEALDIVNLSYGAGASTSLDVLDAQRRARDADTSVAVAEDAARQARLDFLVGSGRFP
jgi:outer membrane protein TolC